MLRTELRTNSAKHSNILIIAFMLTLLSLSIFIHFRLKDYAYDDAYIHFRVVENLTQSGYPYFNEGEAVNVSSSPGWTMYLFLLMNLLKFLGFRFQLPSLVAVNNSIILLTGAFVYSSLLYRISKIKRSLWFYICFFIAYLGLCAPSSIGLMETVSALLIVGIAFHALFTKRKISITLFCIAIFFRLELFVLFALVLIFILYKNYFSFFDVILYSLFGFLPFVIYDLFYFNTLIPNTVNAKSITYSLTILESLADLFSKLFDYLFLIPNFEQLAKYYLIYFLYLPMLLISVYILYMRKNYQKGFNVGDHISIILFFWGIIILLSYISQQIKFFSWYIPLISVPLLTVCGYTLTTITSTTSYRIFKFFSGG